jgi:histidinol-phosphate aminotransferase
LSWRPKRAIAGLKPGVHGGIDAAELKALGIDPAGVLDFSVCTNPFMPPPGIREILAAAPVERYPDSRAAALVERLSDRLGTPAANILAGNGTTELIRLIALAYLRRGDPVVIPGPTYGEYEIAVRLAGARPIPYFAGERDGFAPDIEELAAIIRRRRPRAIFICNPNNPTGRYLPRRDIERILDSLGDGLLVLDEAYIAFAGAAWDSLDLTGRGNAVVLRSMTKDYGLPGLRLGYAVARREIIAALHAVVPPWNVNAIAQAVGAAVLEREPYLKETLRKTREVKDYLAAGIARLGFEVIPSDVHYFLVKVGDAAACRHSLVKNGFLVRDCASFGLKEYIRVSPRTLPECERFLRAFGDVPTPKDK